ncbi:peptidoglycan editing factor PgeF [Prochlorococcus marinus]|uniref:Purine nucleoside phosphorylase n=1 Tax=Prochlorococcus marinus XMU1408 TaxID=2213228 RepID=A0A318RFN9_PROMR|nr:peptidoglycan editing factor PgeF [Prochlorococcus marinus]MBW3041555.1 peptidoglycan editing factor PgeF [Prochlorococcus marinus str. XMU1408]PYE02713.1 peptidoglycan editing factor PgeF [Prochlorococcus marinus XMU1408]
MKLINYNNTKYFQSSLLKEHGFINAFFTKRHKKNKPGELQNELNLVSNINYLKQVHSNKILQVNNTLDLESNFADCLITKKKFQSLWVYTADCIPILIADKKTRQIAACHSGLKGIKKHIISKLLKIFTALGAKKSNLIIALGPSIKGDNYQVMTKDVEDLIIELTGKGYMESYLYKIEGPKEEELNLYRKDPNPDRLLIDIQAAAILQLYNEGIKQSQIDLNRLCTYSNPKLFNSYRRNNTKLRQWSCIYS